MDMVDMTCKAKLPKIALPSYFTVIGRRYVWLDQMLEKALTVMNVLWCGIMVYT